LEEGKNFVVDTTFISRHYKFAPICIATSLVRMYYVLHRSKTMTQACVLLGIHEHQVATRPLNENKEMAHNLIRQEYEKTPIATPLTIAMLASKVFLGSKIIGLNHGSQPKLQGDKFDLLLEEFSPLSSPNIQNQVNNLKLGNGSKGSIDQILELKR
jgi:hypothetical protein